MIQLFYQRYLYRFERMKRTIFYHTIKFNIILYNSSLAEAEISESQFFSNIL